MGDEVYLDSLYDDFDGVTVLFDPVAIEERYGKQGESFDYDVHPSLTRLMSLHEAAAFGTPGGTYRAVVRAGAPHGVDCGILRSPGRLRLGGWHAFTYACDCNDGVIDAPNADGAPEFPVPEGWYRVTSSLVDEDEAPDFQADEDEEIEGSVVIITLTALSEDEAARGTTPERVPGELL